MFSKIERLLKHFNIACDSSNFAIIIAGNMQNMKSVQNYSGPEVVKPECSLKLKIKRNDWLLADTCPQATNHCALF